MHIIQKFIDSIKSNGIISTFKKIYNLIIRIADRIIIKLLSFIPVKDYIVLESQGDFTDSIRVFYDYMIQKHYNNTYKLIWIVHEPYKYDKINNVVFVSRFHFGIHLKVDYYAAVSKYFLFSHPSWLKKWRKSQTVINTSHSVAQLKATYNPNIKFDYILCCSPYCGQIKEKVFDITEGKLLMLGLPRLDLMFHHYNYIKEIYTGYTNEHIIVSMETFKQALRWDDSSEIDKYAINVIKNNDEIYKLNNFLEEMNSIMIIKIHHLQNMEFIKKLTLKNIIFLTDADLNDHNMQTNNLLENADVLLTDYSSVFYDYLLMDRPIGFLLGDMNNYTRGFLKEDPLKDMPGAHIYNFQDLLNFLSQSIKGVDEYSEDRKRILDEVFLYKDAKNCERLYDWIITH